MAVYIQNIFGNNPNLTIAINKAYRVFDLVNLETLELRLAGETDDILILEKLEGCRLAAIVFRSSPNKIGLWNLETRKEVAYHVFSNTIVGVRVNREIVVVCLEDRIYILNRLLRMERHIRDTVPNPQGVIAWYGESSLLAYPCCEGSGVVSIFSTEFLCEKIMFTVHDNELVAVAFDAHGKFIATASKHGMKIRVFSVADGIKVHEFLRGSTYVTISSLNFSACGRFLACSSNTASVHVFKLPDPNEDRSDASPDDGWLGYLTSYIFSEEERMKRSFARAYLPHCDVKSVVSVMRVQAETKLMAVTEQGMMYIYHLDRYLGGRLTMQHQHNLMNSPDFFAKAAAASMEANEDGVVVPQM